MYIYNVPVLAGLIEISKYISIPDELVEYLDKKCPKDEEGKREETYSMTIQRLLKRSEAK